MKRIWAQTCVWLCCFSLLVLVGCSAGSGAVPPVTNGFTCTAAIDYRELSVEGTMTCLDDGKLMLSFTHPDTLSGVTISWDGERMAMELAGVTVHLEESAIPQSALIKSVLEVLNASHGDGVLLSTALSAWRAHSACSSARPYDCLPYGSSSIALRSAEDSAS